jgi:thioredoxin-like negative regulator of GroEL
MKTGLFAPLALAASIAFAAPLAAGATGWHDDAERAFAAARASGQPLLVDLYADWCGWCKVLDAEVFSTPEFAEVARGYELLRVDVEDRGAGTELAAVYGAGELPTLLVLEPTGALVGEVVGYHPPPEFLARLRATSELHGKRLEVYREALASDDPEWMSRVARDLYARRDGARAAELYGRLLATTTLRGDDAAWMRLYHADALRLARRYDEARRATELAATAAAKTKDRTLAERVALLPFWIARDERRCADARSAYAEFVGRHPRSRLRSGAENALARLDAAGETCS